MTKTLTITATIRCPAPTDAESAKAMADAAGGAFSKAVLETCNAARQGTRRFAPGVHVCAQAARTPARETR